MFLNIKVDNLVNPYRKSNLKEKKRQTEITRGTRLEIVRVQTRTTMVAVKNFVFCFNSRIHYEFPRKKGGKLSKII